MNGLFGWLTAQTARVSHKFDLGQVMASMLRRQDGFQQFLGHGHLDIDSILSKTPPAARP